MIFIEKLKVMLDVDYRIEITRSHLSFLLWLVKMEVLEKCIHLQGNSWNPIWNRP